MKDLSSDAAKPEASSRFCLLVIGEQGFATHWLPDKGQVTIGSESSCDVQVDEPSVAPLHAVIEMGDEFAIEDRGSAAGTRVVGTALIPGQPKRLQPGDLIHVGAVMLVVQRKASAPPRRIWPHGYFESRLEEECIRAERFQTVFGVVRVRCVPELKAREIEDILSNALRIVDIVGAYGPAEYEVLLTDTHPEGAKLVRDRIFAELIRLDPTARVGLACYPSDGKSGDSLSAKAGVDMHQVNAEPTGGPIQAASIDDVGLIPFGKLVERIAASTITVLILGETGAGKEKLAEQVHLLSPRATKPFLRLNCAALTESLLESELFGHERGAFTGAIATKQGLLESAEGGTVFLDEVGEMPMSTQVKLLRVLEERQVLRVGSLKSRSIDVRFVAATNRDLEAEIVRGNFRQDLFFRLNGVSIVIPPLRERVNEIEPLTKLFIADTARKMARAKVPVLAPPVLSLMQRYSWPGNIRELRNVIERAVVLCPEEVITLAYLPVEKMSASFVPRRPPTAPPSNLGASPPLASTLDRHGDDLSADGPMRSAVKREVEGIERQRILNALARCAGNQTEAAKLLGISRRTLVNRLEAYGIARPRKGRKAPTPSET